jgi:peptide/nickel transport system permease protein
MATLYMSSAILLLWMLTALVAPIYADNAQVIHLHKLLALPDAQAWLGYDDLGRPVMERLVQGARTSFGVAVVVVSCSVAVGMLVGCLAGFRGGWIDRVLSGITDVVLAFPGLLLAIALAGLLGPGVGNVIIALVCVGWVGYARLVRAQVMSLKQRDHVRAAQALGLPAPLIVLRHILPLTLAPVLIEATFGVAAVIMAEAGLSFLGLGVQPPQASWGSMIRDGARYLLVTPHLMLAPGMLLLLVVLAVNHLGDRLRDVLDVRARRQEL